METLGVNVSIFPKELYTENDDDKEKENDESEKKIKNLKTKVVGSSCDG